MDQAEASGKTVEDALSRALAELGASREEVEFVVLDEGRKGGLFGRGGKEAVVRVERVANAGGAAPAPPPDTRIPRGNRGGSGGGNRARGGAPQANRNREGGRPARSQTRSGFDSAVPKLTDADFRTPSYDANGAPAPSPAPAEGAGNTRRRRGGRGRGGAGAENPTGESAPANRPPREDRPPRDRDREGRRRDDEPRIEPDINAEGVDFAAQTVDDILRILDIDAELNIREPLTAGDGLGSALAVIDIKGDDLGLLIGRRGDTLIALQYLVNLILARKFPGKGGITIDVEHYKHRREEQVVSLAKRMADRVRETGSPITLEPMSAGERRIIHLLFAEDAEVETNSIGEGDNRKVVISSRR